LTSAATTSPADITEAVVESFTGCEDHRLRLLVQSLVHHLHALATDVHLTHSEWVTAIRILTATGKITDE